MSIGETLRSAREEKELSDVEIADATHMMIQMVREIEQDDFHRFAAPIYGKGFIKLFAQAVGLDPAPLVAEYLALHKRGAPTPRSTATPPPPATPRPAPPREEPAAGGDTPDGHPAATPQPLRASSVTLPRSDSPFSPANQPPARRPATPPKRRPPQPGTSGSGDTFSLKSDTVSSDVPPQPVEKPKEPFSFPSPARRAPAEAPPNEPRPTQNRVTHPPGSETRRPALSDVLAHAASRIRQAMAALRERIAIACASDEDEDDARIRKRYVMTGALVCITVLAIVIIAASSPDTPVETDNAPPPPAEQVAATDPPPPPPTHEPATEIVPDGPVEIVRVLPAPRMFAR